MIVRKWVGRWRCRYQIYYACQYVRVVKEADSKSAGFSRAGSNPAADVFDRPEQSFLEFFYSLMQISESIIFATFPQHWTPTPKHPLIPHPQPHINPLTSYMKGEYK